MNMNEQRRVYVKRYVDKYKETQPGKAVLFSKGMTIAGVARAIGINRNHLHTSLMGITPPCPELRERLPKYLDITLEETFTPALLARPYKGYNALPKEK
jgi:hypothetical protein